MEFNELLAAFAAKFGVKGLDGAEGAAELDVAASAWSCWTILRRIACSPAPRSDARRPTQTVRSAR